MIYHHLTFALEIMRKEPDYRLWGPLIDALPTEAQEECRTWLRQEARMSKHRTRSPDMKPFPMVTSAAFSKTAKRR